MYSGLGRDKADLHRPGEIKYKAPDDLVRLGWVGLGWVGLGWVGLGLVKLA